MQGRPVYHVWCPHLLTYPPASQGPSSDPASNPAVGPSAVVVPCANPIATQPARSERQPNLSNNRRPASRESALRQAQAVTQTSSSQPPPLQLSCGQRRPPPPFSCGLHHPLVCEPPRQLPLPSSFRQQPLPPPLPVAWPRLPLPPPFVSPRLPPFWQLRLAPSWLQTRAPAVRAPRLLPQPPLPVLRCAGAPRPACSTPHRLPPPPPASFAARP